MTNRNMSKFMPKAAQKNVLKTVFLVILALVIVLTMVKLGFWQLSRAEQKQLLQTEMLQKQAVVIDMQQQRLAPSHRFSKAELTGHYLPADTLFLDSQVHNSAVGYHVITPFKIDDSDTVILVNRGWVPVGGDRQVKPAIMTPKHRLSLSGRLNLPPSKPAIWDDSLSAVQDGAWQYLDLAEYAQATQQIVSPLLLELNKSLDQAGGFVRQWRTYDNQWVGRHKAYALQWFSMAVVFAMMCLYIVRPWRKNNKSLD